jgi:hypothetical protein
MRMFNGRAASEEYMSTHSLTFSTPEMTLKKFALWLSEIVDDPVSKGRAPRLLHYLEEKDEQGGKKYSDFMPDVDETFKPSGAVTEIYNSSSPQLQSNKTLLDRDSPESEKRFCTDCGSKMKPSYKFCIKCGSRQI